MRPRSSFVTGRLLLDWTPSIPVERYLDRESLRAACLEIGEMPNAFEKLERSTLLLRRRLSNPI